MKLERADGNAGKGGYSLIELIVTISIIMIGLGSLYGVMRRGLDQMKLVGGRDYAVAAAASELEFVKAIPKEELPDNYTGRFKSKVDLSPLNGGRGYLRIREFKGSEGRLKRVTATVSWNAAGRQRKLSVSTLVGPP
jgi:hypothetical protein